MGQIAMFCTCNKRDIGAAVAGCGSSYIELSNPEATSHGCSKRWSSLVAATRAFSVEKNSFMDNFTESFDKLNGK